MLREHKNTLAIAAIQEQNKDTQRETTFSEFLSFADRKQKYLDNLYTEIKNKERIPTEKECNFIRNNTCFMDSEQYHYFSKIHLTNDTKPDQNFLAKIDYYQKQSTNILKDVIGNRSKEKLLTLAKGHSLNFVIMIIFETLFSLIPGKPNDNTKCAILDIAIGVLMIISGIKIIENKEDIINPFKITGLKKTLMTQGDLNEIESKYTHYGYTPNTYQKEDSLSSSPLK